MTDPYPTGPVVYILRNGKSLYVGATIDLSHRIRQHNGELSGGAHRTSTKGPGWVCLLYVQGFQSRTESLQFEYALKRELLRVDEEDKFVVAVLLETGIREVLLRGVT